jgi:hypothetical protein
MLANILIRIPGALDSGLAPSARPGMTAEGYIFFTASLVDAASPHTGASAPSPQLRGR